MSIGNNFKIDDKRKLTMKFASVLIICSLTFTSTLSFAQEKLGIVLMHGKQGGGAGDKSLDLLNQKLHDAGMWSSNLNCHGHLIAISTAIGMLRCPRSIPMSRN